MNKSEENLKRYVISRETIDYLLGILNDVNLKGKILESKNNKIYKNSYFTNFFYVDLTKEEAENIIEEISDDLSIRGFDINSEPNELGLQIEGIINIFSKVYYEDEE